MKTFRSIVAGTNAAAWGIFGAVLLPVFSVLAQTPSPTGPLNVVAPAPAPAAEVCAALARALDRPLLMRAPDWAMRAALGEKADAIYSSVRAAPDRLRQSGFRFAHPAIDEALRWELGLVTPAEAGVEVEWT